MKITLLGTNGWFDTATGSTPCVLVQTSQHDIVFDAGYGFTKVDQLITGERPVYLLLSHVHLDHLIGLHTLPKSKFSAGLTIIGQPGTQQALNGLMTPVYSIPLSRLRYPVTVREVDIGDIEGLPFYLKALPLIHSGPCFGYRLVVDGKVITYCTDTGYCESAVELARGADLLMTECSQSPGTQPNNGWPHLGPEEAARIAVESGARCLVLIHFDPTHYPVLDDRIAAQTEARKIFTQTDSGRDGMTFEFE